MVPLARAARTGTAGPDRRDLTVADEGWTLRYDNRDGDWMAYDYRSADRTLAVSGSLPWPVRAEPLAGVVCGVLLGLETRTLLHGACLKLGETCFALLGASGHGKSTLAAALVREGASLVSEDLLVAARTPAGWTVEPGAPSLHLLPDSYAMLGPTGVGTAKVRDGKYALDLPAAAAGPAPLAGLYLLDPPDARATAQLARLSGRRALLRVFEHIYGKAWIRSPGETDLRFCAALVADVPVHALSRPWSLAAVPETAAMLRRHLSGR